VTDDHAATLAAAIAHQNDPESHGRAPEGREGSGARYTTGEAIGPIGRRIDRPGSRSLHLEPPISSPPDRLRAGRAAWSM
jgi:hypothetical protein